MIDAIFLKNYAVVHDVSWNNLSGINVIIGENGTGKTTFLKAVYSAIRTTEEYQRGEDNKSLPDIILNKLYWTFQVEKIGDLVNKKSDNQLEYEMILNGKNLNINLEKTRVSKLTMWLVK